MPRRPPDGPAPTLQLKEARKPFLSVTLKVVTPMFGGSATPGVVDPELPVTAKSVRGHLRFWWRACRAHTFTSPEDLFQAEAAIWGQSAAKKIPTAPSAIDVGVTIDDKGQKLPVEQHLPDEQWTRDQYGYPSYALFPFQRQNDPPRPPQRAQINVIFTVKLSFAAHITSADFAQLEKEATSALWAWITFGGVGARTRRGCGSLWCETRRFHPVVAANAPNPDETVAAWLKGNAKVHCAGDIDPGCVRTSLLSGTVVLLPHEAEMASMAWKRAVDEMSSFRQGEGFARSYPANGNKFPGKSWWPEADSIRNISGMSILRHTPDNPHLRYFPRADLGLPIVFHFKQDNPADPDHKDPQNHTLQLADTGATKDATRMASPFILKPLMISPTHALAMVALLDAPWLADIGNDLRLIPKQGHQVVIDNPDDVDNPGKAAAVGPMNHEDNARDAFIKFVQGEHRWNTRRVVL